MPVDSADSAPLRWGIFGCGRISHTFASNVKPLAASTLHACAARSLSNAQAFAAKHAIPRAYDSYETLCVDPEVDVVYIGTLHPFHCEHATLALTHGKHVLVEKPMAMNTKEAASVIALAREKRLFFMEGMWTRFFPAIRFVRELIANKEIGDVHHMHAAFGVAFKPDNERIWSRELGGGGLLDIGVYELAFVTMALGVKPEKVTAAGKLNDAGVDVYNSVTLEYSDQRFATIEYSMLTKMSETVTITGTKGRVFIQAPAHATKEISVVKELANGQQEEKRWLFPWPNPDDHHSGFLYEAEAVVQAIKSKQLEREEYPPDESLGIMTIMDTIRGDLGLVYPADAE